ncbi:MAG: 5-(carboxyamino)imidazole ribonucleotide synthase [Anaerolineae bacterium]|nr:5-(carboxyamino)imidazole ribonucleotide synthase [Thermoflexales bacterium]MDW8406597.1 5-(carboxyamino)imidazole ribonucleotide synthase [Anaerolineae bacterium]
MKMSLDSESPTIAVLGGGQLGRMLALAGYPLGLRFRFLDPAPQAPAGHLAELVVAEYDDLAGLERLIAGAHTATYEFENVPARAAAFLSQRLPVYPPAHALETAQDRLAEKTCFRSLGIPTPDFASVDTWDDLTTAVRRLGYPAVLKTRRLGYDGKGQRLLRNPSDLAPAWAALGGTPLILEQFVPFDRELSVLAVRSVGGEIVLYPPVQNHHRDGILRVSLAPAPALSTDLQQRCEDYARRLLQHLDYVGVLAIELFQLGTQLLANEMAPRVHNSGHWTIEGATTSQFENHLRAVLGWPLGKAAPRGYCAMINLIGDLPPLSRALALSGAHVHLYGKAPRPGRKLGHITFVEPSEAGLAGRLAALHSELPSLVSGLSQTTQGH